MPTTTLGYYTKDNVPFILNDGVVAGSAAAISAFSTALVNTVTSANPGLLALKVIAANETLTGAATTTLNIIVNDDETFSIDGYLDGTTFAFGATLASSITIAVLAAFGGPVGILGTVAISAGQSLVFSAIDQVTDLFFDIDDPVNLQFFDNNGELQSGFFYPDGLDGTSNEHVNAVLNFISQAGHEIENGGRIVFDEFGLDDEFTIHNGNFIKDLVNFTSAKANNGITAIEDFLLAGNNLNTHAFKSFYNGDPVEFDDHYFFFEEGEDLELSIPVIIDGEEHIITVNNVIRGNVLQFGDGDGKNVVYPNSANIISSSDGDDLILGATNIDADEGDDTVIGTEGNDTIIGSNGDDIIDGGAGDDILNGGDDKDIIYGGADNDTIIGSEGKGEIIDGGEGVDFVDFTQLGTLYDVDIHTNLSNGKTLLDYAGIGSDNQTLHNIENVTTGGGNEYHVAVNDNVISNFRLSIAV